MILTPIGEGRDGGEVVPQIFCIYRFAPGDQGTALPEQNAIVASLAQGQFGGGLDPDEEIPARELIRHILGDIGGITAVDQPLGGEFGKLSQILILRFGEGAVGECPEENRQGEKQSGKEDHKGAIQELGFLAAAHLDSKKPCRFAVTFRCFHKPLPQCGTQSPPLFIIKERLAPASFLKNVESEFRIGNRGRDCRKN